MTFILVSMLWLIGLVAAQHLVAWLHAPLLFGLLNHATNAMRRNRPA